MSAIASNTEKRAKDLIMQCLSYFQLLESLEMTDEDYSTAKQAENCLRKIIKDAKYEWADIVSSTLYRL